MLRPAPMQRFGTVRPVGAELLAARAGVLADRTRATICLALLDGRAWTASELARLAGVADSTASEHLSLLVGAGLLSETRQGRHRYLRLAGPHVAELLEDLAGAPDAAKGLRPMRASERLVRARSCYDHLAGELGVAVHRSLTEQGLLAASGLTDRGRGWFGELLGLGCLERHGTRPLVRDCLDWTERLPHLGGALGAALAAHAVHEGWLRRSTADRAVEVTPAGDEALRRLFGVWTRPARPAR